eukprot:scaffold159296_cov83-Cyclotella_meneghiniana.AAC.2
MFLSYFVPPHLYYSYVESLSDRASVSTIGANVQARNERRPSAEKKTVGHKEKHPGRYGSDNVIRIGILNSFHSPTPRKEAYNSSTIIFACATPER